MKTSDFEKAIDALNCDIEIDEMKLRNGQVRLVLGHTDHMLLVWDENGRGFGIPYGEPYFCTEENHAFHDLDDYERDAKFDLKFE